MLRKQNKYTVIYIYKRVVWGNYKKQWQNGDDYIVGIFTLKAQHRVNTFHPLRLCLSTKHQ